MQQRRKRSPTKESSTSTRLPESISAAFSCPVSCLSVTSSASGVETG